MRTGINFSIVLFGLLSLHFNCTRDKPPASEPAKGPFASVWITRGDQSVLLQKQTDHYAFGTTANSFPAIDVDSTERFQTIDGFGYTLTGGSAMLINRLNAAEKSALLQELFGKDEKAIGISYLRVSIGASDLSPEVFSYNDLPAGEKDLNLTKFSLAQDTVDLIPLLQQMLAINPGLKIMGTPWSPPVWMKDNGNSVGGSLLPQYYNVYARYLVRYIQEMKKRGITIDAITPQNEPLHPGNNPSMLMTAAQQKDFVKNHLGPAFQQASVNTRIIIYDHNCDRPDYPLEILNDPAAKAFVDGSAFHLYAGNINALSDVHNAHPEKNVYFTEQWTSANGDFGGDLKWHLKNVLIGSMRNWSKIVLEWNLANDGGFRPHTPGGCTECKGAITLDGTVNRNVAYYIIAHASRFVPPGSRRIESSIVADLPNVAFITPSGRKVLIVLNDGTAKKDFNIRFNKTWITASLDAGAVGTYTW